MALTKKKLEELLTHRLELADPEFHLERSGRRLVGHVISPTFRGRRDHERQNLIWDALEASLGAEAVLQVGMLLAYTPEEWDIDEDEKPAAKRRKKAG